MTLIVSSEPHIQGNITEPEPLTDTLYSAANKAERQCPKSNCFVLMYSAIERDFS